VRTKVRVSAITSKELKRTLKKSGSKRRTASRAAVFKSDSWYANAALSIGVSAKAQTNAH
jgi:hypothetical protein